MKSKVLLFVAFLSLFLACSAAAEWSARASGVTNDINAICFPTRTIGFAVGNGVVIKTTTAGTSWATIPGLTGTYYDVFFPTSLEGYVLGVQGTSGVVLKTTDGGGAFQTMTFPGVATSAYIKVSSLGVYRAIVGTLEGGANSILLYSSDSGESWASKELTGMQVGGVFLGEGDGTTPFTRWTWGVENGIAVITDEVNTPSTFSGTPIIRDLYSPSTQVVYAAFSDGAVYKTSNSGQTWTNFSPSGAGDKLNALSFLTDDFGWVAGKSGFITFTADGGLNWSSYTLSNSFDINAISATQSGIAPAGINAATIRVRASALALVYAFIAGSGGNIAQLESPKITSISPATKAQGFIGTAEITGLGFIDGVQVTFEGAGVIAAAASFESNTKILVNLRIKDDAALGAHDMLVTNPDATASRETNAFNVTAGSTAVSFSNIWFNTNKYSSPEASASTTPKTTILNLPSVSFEVNSANGVTPATVNAQVIGHYPRGTDYGTYIFSPLIPASQVSVVSANTIEAFYQFSGSSVFLPTGEVIDFMLYGNDAAGNVGSLSLLTWVASSDSSGGTIPGAKSNDTAAFFPTQNHWDYETQGTLPVQIRFKDGVVAGPIVVTITDMKGSRVYSKEFDPASGGFTTKLNINITSLELPPYLSPGMYMVRINDKATGALRGTGKLMIVPSNLTP